MTVQINEEIFRENLWDTWAEELTNLKRQKEAIRAREEELKGCLINFVGEREKYAGGGVKLFKRTTKGSVKWKEIPEIAELSDDYIDSFRGEERTSWVMEVQ